MRAWLREQLAQHSREETADIWAILAGMRDSDNPYFSLIARAAALAMVEIAQTELSVRN